MYSFRADIPKPPWQPRRRDALVGVAIHYAIAHTIRTGDTETIYEPTKHDDAVLHEDERAVVEETHATWILQWWNQERAKPEWQAELAIGVDPVCGCATLVPIKAEHRDYSALGEEFVPGTVDAVRYDAAVKTVHIKDWKGGNGYDLAARPADENKQLATLAVAFAAHFGAERAIVGIGKVRPNGVTLDEAELNSMDLAEHRAWLADRLRAMPTAEPNDGPHCRALFCSMYGTCPATIGALAQVAPEAEAITSIGATDTHVRLPIVSDPNQIRDAAHARYQYETLRAAQAAIESRMAACWDAVRQWSDVHDGVPLANGMVWKRVVHPRDSIDLGVVGATNALEHVLGPAWRSAVEMSTSKRAIEDAARPIALARTAAGEKTTIAGLKRAVVEALKTIGAVKTGQRVAYEECEAPSAPEHLE